MLTRLTPAGRHLLDLFFPAPCLACGELEPPETGSWRYGQAQRIGLCARCRLALTPQPRPACQACARPFPGVALPQPWLCPGCRRRSRANRLPHERLIVAWVYRPPIDSVILALKFRGLRYLARGLAESLASRVALETPRPEVVVPVPLHWRRQFARGYNQAEELASAVARRLGLPLVRALRRARPTRPQMSLALAERQANLRRSFAGHRGARKTRGRRVLLVDDVVTSGATLGEAARCLRRSGAREVYGAAVARAPDPGSESAAKARERLRGLALSSPCSASPHGS